MLLLHANPLRLACAAAALLAAVPAARADAPAPKAIAATYVDIAAANYADAHAAAVELQKAVAALIAKPSDATLAAARAAWVASRPSYMQTEAFRFGNKIVDDWEGNVNSWPLDEGLIDYVAGEYGTENPENEYYAANVIANTSLKAGSSTLDAKEITPELIQSLQEAGGVEANVSVGYHAIEFLLWGQDVNGTGPGAGNRPATDFDTKACTNDHCDRRAKYLEVVTAMLVDELKSMAEKWQANGPAREAVLANGASNVVTTILTGLGSLSYGELAGERMKLGLLLNDPEEEQDCFSDNTHNSLFYDVIGIRNVYLGTYARRGGGEVKGSSVSDLVKAKSPEADAAVRKAIDNTVAKMTAIKERAEKIERYDQMIGQGNTEGNAVVQAAIDALIAQAKELERAMATLGLEGVKFEGSKSLDAPSQVGKKG